MKISKKDFFGKQKFFSKSKHFVRYLIPIFLLSKSNHDTQKNQNLELQQSKFKNNRTEEIQDL